MSILLMTAMLFAPIASEPFTSPPPPSAGRSGVGQDVQWNFYQLHRDLIAAEAGGEISADSARDLRVSVERIRRQMIRMGDVVGIRQRHRLQARIDAVRARLAQSRVSGGVEG